jgi:hypothetical protein
MEQVRGFEITFNQSFNPLYSPLIPYQTLPELTGSYHLYSQLYSHRQMKNPNFIIQTIILYSINCTFNHYKLELQHQPFWF